MKKIFGLSVSKYKTIIIVPAIVLICLFIGIGILSSLLVSIQNQRVEEIDQRKIRDKDELEKAKEDIERIKDIVKILKVFKPLALIGIGLWIALNIKLKSKEFKNALFGQTLIAEAITGAGLGIMISIVEFFTSFFKEEDILKCLLSLLSLFYLAPVYALVMVVIGEIVIAVFYISHISKDSGDTVVTEEVESEKGE